MEIHLQAHQDKMRDPSSWGSNFWDLSLWNFWAALWTEHWPLRKWYSCLAGLSYLGFTVESAQCLSHRAFRGLISPLYNATAAKYLLQTASRSCSTWGVPAGTRMQTKLCKFLPPSMCLPTLCPLNVRMLNHCRMPAAVLTESLAQKVGGGNQRL